MSRRALFKRARIYGWRNAFPIALEEAKYQLLSRAIRASYSQGGEDLVIDRLLGGRSEGFYVDVGANDPWRFSNTARFYKRGWKGINVEPDPIVYERLAAARSRDINLNLGVGCADGELPFYHFFPDTFSTFSTEQAARSQEKGLELVETLAIPVSRLDDLLSEHLGEREIDFLSVDVEGTELDVLLSNDWERFRPVVIVVESTEETGSGVAPDPDCDRILTAAGYEAVAVNALNVIYRRS